MSNSRKNTALTSDHNLMVCLRIRPMNEDELNLGIPLITHNLDNNVVVLLDPLEDPDDILRANRSRERQFIFDHVFNGGSSQEEVFNLSTLPLLSQVLDGYTATVFAYGPTGAGKTYTMLGVDEQPGIMFKALDSLFRQMDKLDNDYVFQVSLSYLEVYNEMIRDLLNTSSAVLDLREDQNGVQVAGLTEIDVNTTNEVMDLLKRGNAARSVEATGANKHSSRSHCVLQVTLLSRSRSRNIQEQVTKGKLYLIDLAGSERAANTMNRGKRMTEGAHINRSLLALGNCINALSDPNAKRYINYRDSKLTRLLKDALGGNCRTVMIAHVSPTAPHFEDSRNTLVYADRAKHIKTKIHKNMYDVNFHLVQYNSIIAELKQEIHRLRNKIETFHLTMDTDEPSTNIISMPEQVEEMKLKDQFLIAFQRHLDCKKNLSENLINDLDLNLEESRCQVIISEWESKKAERISLREKKSDDADIEDEEKQMEMAGMDFMSEPENIIMTRNELRLAQMERQKLQPQKEKFELELETHSLKIKQMESTINERVKNGSSKQFLHLLCRLHKLEIQQSDLRTENIILRQQGSRHDLLYTALLRHNDLCNQIIIAQSAFIADSLLDLPKELEMLMELYEKDEFTRNISSTLMDNAKGYYNYNGRELVPEADSNSDIRDITSDMSIHDNNQEEQESNVSVVNNNNRQRTPDTWDNDSFHPLTMKNAQDYSHATNPGGPKRIFDPVLKGQNVFKHGNIRPQHKSLFPDLRGRPLGRVTEYNDKSTRSRSFGPEGNKAKQSKDGIAGVPLYNRIGNSRRLMMGPRLDNTDQQIMVIKKYRTKHGAFKNPLLNNYSDPSTSSYNKKTTNTDERTTNPRVLRANEIRKLNERKALDGFQEVDSITDFIL